MSQSKMAGDNATKGVVKSICSLPDVILQHILSFIPTKDAIKTSLWSILPRGIAGDNATKGAVESICSLAYVILQHMLSFLPTKDAIKKTLRKSQSQMAGDSGTKGSVESICSLPDVILQHILSFIPTEDAIRTSVLSRRWRHVWCETPTLSFNTWKNPTCLNETLDRYTVAKMMNFALVTSVVRRIPDVDYDRWIEFAMSRNVEQLYLHFDYWDAIDDGIPALLFYINPSLSWKSLKKLSLTCCSFSDKSMSKILSGCPLLQSLQLYFCEQPEILDLSQSLLLRTLEIVSDHHIPGPTYIVAPHIHRLRLTIPQLPCTLVDVSSLAEAHLELSFSRYQDSGKADFLQDTGLKILEKLKNLEKLTFDASVLEIFLISERRGVPSPMLKVKTLTLETSIHESQIPGLKRLLQNSPDLKKLKYHNTFYTMDWISVSERGLDYYLDLQGSYLKGQTHSTWLFP